MTYRSARRFTPSRFTSGWLALAGLLGCASPRLTKDAALPATPAAALAPRDAPASPAAQPAAFAQPAGASVEAGASASEPASNPFDADRAQRVWSLSLHHALAATPGNLVHSPLSAATLLAMLYRGARNDTQRELGRAVWPGADPGQIAAASAQRAGILSAHHSEVVTASANAAFISPDLPLLPDFRSALETELHAQVSALDFAAPSAKRILDQWASKATKGLLNASSPTDGLTADTKLIVMNALYFKGWWQQRFNPAHTVVEPFALDGGEQVKTQLMHRTLDTGYAELPAEGTTPAVRAVELSYRGGNFSLVVILPALNKQLAPLETSFDETRLHALVEEFRERAVKLALPRFHFASPAPVSLKESLKRVGVRRVFESNLADFSGISTPSSTSPPLFVSDIYQSVYLKVDETGTEAAAVSTGKVSTRSGKFREPPVEFRVDQPFLFLLRHRPSDTVLMMGRINDPR